MSPVTRTAESRTEHLLTELLRSQGWDCRRPPAGEVLIKQEYKNHVNLHEVFRATSKSGPGAGLPEAVLVNRESLAPLAVVEAKAYKADIELAINEAQGYADACIAVGYSPLAIGIAGTSEDYFDVRVHKWTGTRWVPVTYDGRPINWIPNKADLDIMSARGKQSELRPTVPPPEVLAERANEINRLLRESGIMDQMRPGVIGAIMLGLWHSRGQIRKEEKYILADINHSCQQAFWGAKKTELANSIRVDEANRTLAIKTRRIVSILERLNVTVLTAEHDYLGQLYETFFRYTGGNTIGQYFTPRHIATMMAELVEVGKKDIVLDPACGTGGFLIAAMNRIMEREHVSRTQMVRMVKSKLLGFDQEPQTAALCVANMILRGDGSTGVKRGDCFTSPDYPIGKAHVVLMNPPFPHEKTDTPPDQFIDRALEGLRHRGRLAVIVPMQILVRRDKAIWRDKILAQNTLDAIITLPDELFQPYASSNTNIVVITKGVPHQENKPVFFARIDNDGFRLRKNVRIQREGSQIPDVLRAYQCSQTILGICGTHELGKGNEWRPGAYIPARRLSPAEVLNEVGLLVRSKTALVVKYAPQFRQLRASLREGRLIPKSFRLYKKRQKQLALPGEVIGSYFEIFYGQSELETKDALGTGDTPIISSSGADNGCYGFYDFDWLISPPVVTVPRTGSIGMAHVQEWPVGASSDNLILLPRKGTPEELLYIAAAVIRQERWRFNYGSKITPSRIAQFPLPHDEITIKAVRSLIESSVHV
ncbi:MAG: N-6 DNA methylase, partial [Pseudomonadota bacterium]